MVEPDEKDHVHRNYIKYERGGREIEREGEREKEREISFFLIHAKKKKCNQIKPNWQQRLNGIKGGAKECRAATKPLRCLQQAQWRDCYCVSKYDNTKFLEYLRIPCIL